MIGVAMLFLAGTASAAPGVEIISVTPVVDTIDGSSGGEATFHVTIAPTPEIVPGGETVSLTLDSAWSYGFIPNGFTVMPSSSPVEVALNITVPAGTFAGDYLLDVNSLATAIEDPDLTEIAHSTVTVHVTGISPPPTPPPTPEPEPIPEFPAVAFPIMSITGLILMFRMRKQ